MALTADQITAQNFADFYNKIKPYLNGGGVGLKLLWENSDPTSEFVSGSVQMSSNDYDLPIVLSRYSKNQSYLVPANIGNNGYINFSDYSSEAKSVYRTYSINGLTATFGTANYNGTNNNAYMIPYRIYGIKVYNRADISVDRPLIDINNDGKFTALVRNGFVDFDINAAQVSASADWQTVCTLPSGYRPRKDVFSSVMYAGTDFKGCAIRTDGKVQIKSADITGTFYGHFVFSVA